MGSVKKENVRLLEMAILLEGIEEVCMDIIVDDIYDRYYFMFFYFERVA